MLDRLFGPLMPRVPPEQRRPWVDLTRRVSTAVLALLVVLVAAELLSLLLDGAATTFGAVLLHAAVLAIIALLVRRNLLMGQVALAGHLLAGGSLLLAILGLGSGPGSEWQLPLLILLGILISGTIVGGPAPYAYAAAGMLLTLLRWTISPEPFPLVGFFSITALYAGAAVVMGVLSEYIQQTVTALHGQAERLSHLAHTDPLTGLANRRHFLSQLKREFRRARRYRRPLSLLFLDLDGFKTINDHFGHMFGDEILRGAARSMLAVIRSTDLLGRIGGDEFAVLMPETHLEGADNVAGKLSKALASYGEQLGSTIPPLTFCAGLAVMRDGDRSIDDLLARADEAQYLAKTTGKAHTRTQFDLDSPIRQDS